MTEHDAFEARFHEAVRRYAGRASSDLDPVELANRIAGAEPRRHGFAAALAWRGVAIPEIAWILLISALLAALAGTAVVASRLLETVPQPPHHPAALVPSGIDTLTTETGTYVRMVADRDGIVWATAEDWRLLRFDPATGATQTWTVGDDAGFAASDIAPARGGGVWLIGGRKVRWFDGKAFRDVIDAPAEIAIVAEAPDASLWAATTDGAVLHWNGSTWSTLDPGRPKGDVAISTINVDTAGRVWIGGGRYDPCVSRYDGSTWTTFDARDAAPLGGAVRQITQAPDGAIWVATVAGLARFDGSSWTDATPQPSDGTPPLLSDHRTASVAAGPDGAIWIAGGTGPDNAGTAAGAVAVRRFDGRSWVAYGPRYEQPGWDQTLQAYTAWVVPTKDGAYLGTGAGILRLSGDRWERMWPPASSAKISVIRQAVSRDELWAVGEGGLWHFLESAWTSESADPLHPGSWTNDLALAPDGTVWAAGDEGISYRRDGRWTIADARGADTITVDRNGTVWAVRGNEAGTGTDVWTLRFDGTAWVSRSIAECPVPVSRLAFDAGGALWAGAPSGWGPGGLARFDGQTWEPIQRVGDRYASGATVLGTSPNGDVWVDTLIGDQHSAARFDGRDWAVVELPEGADGGAFSGLAVAPDGTLWASVWTSAWTHPSMQLAHYDGRQWTFPYPGVTLPTIRRNPIDGGGTAMGISVAPDGTVFVDRTSGILRFPAQSPVP